MFDQLGMTQTEALIICLLVGFLVAVLFLSFYEQRRRSHCLQQLATEYGGKCYLDPSYLTNNYVCHFRHNSRDYYVTYRPEQGSDGANQLFVVCKVITPFHAPRNGS
jgi:hypothetical protein